MSETTTSGAERVQDPRERVNAAAWDVVTKWLDYEFEGIELTGMAEKIDQLRQALTDGDELGVTSPESPYYASQSDAN